MPLSRRTFLATGSIALLPSAALADIVAPGYPTQPPELTQEMVVVAHGNVARVKELIGRQPALAKAAWDWGFGDWEDALGAASHVGNREIAELLLAAGARPTIFSAAMLGQLDVVKAFVAAAPGVQRTKGPHSITLMQHAVNGGARAQAVVEYLKAVGGADEKFTQQPLSPGDKTKLIGAYVFGLGPAGRLEIAAAGEQLSVARPGMYARGLTHLGSFEFVPIGAEQVRIRFAESGKEMVLTIHDPDVVLTAKKTL